jgi:Flp pilus assembly protein TadB
MADVNRFSERLIDVAERFADVVDAAQGNGSRSSGVRARWLVLPAAGAAAYALATSRSSTARRTRGLMRRAKDRATDLPDADLVGRVKEVTGLAEQGSSAPNGQTRKTNNRAQSQGRGRASTTQRRRKTTASR